LKRPSFERGSQTFCFRSFLIVTPFPVELRHRGAFVSNRFFLVWDSPRIRSPTVRLEWSEALAFVFITNNPTMTLLAFARSVLEVADVFLC